MLSDLPADARPRITGSTSNVVRVAVVQLAFHPAVRASLEDPLGRFDPGADFPLSTLPKVLRLSEPLRGVHRELSERVRQAYVAQLILKLRAVLASCREWGVKIVVLPEYSVPADALEAVAEESHGMVVVAGSGFVDRAVQKSQAYEKLGAPRPGLRQNLAVVLHDGALIHVTAKLGVTREESVPEMKPGSSWEPADLPNGLGPLGVLICLDFLERQYDSYTKLVAPKLDQCRLLAVPALTSARSLSFFQGHMIEEAGPRRRPVLLANHAPGGGSTIAVDERSLENPKDFPLHAGVFEPHEEGVLVADIDLAVVGVGKGGRYGEPPHVRPFAATSFVYSGMTKEVAAWHSSLRTLIPDEMVEGDEEALLDRAIEWLSNNPPPRSVATPMQKHRWDRLLLILDNVKSLREVQRLTRDIVLPPEVLPLAEVECALARGASRVIDAWVKGDMEGSAPFATVAASLEAKAVGGEPGRDSWTDASRHAWAHVAEVVRGSQAKSDVPMVTTPLDRATDTIENQVVKAELDKGNGLAQEGRYEEAAKAFLRARDEAQKQGSHNQIHGEKWPRTHRSELRRAR